MTVQQIARRAGLAPDTINKILSGATQRPSSDTLFRLAEALDCAVSDITGMESAEHEHIDDLKRSIQRLQNRLKQERREKVFFVIVLTALVALIAVMIVIDFCNPNIGWRRW